MRRSQPYKIGLNERLRDSEYAAAYLNAASRESHDVLLLALRDVAEVHKFSKVAAAAGVNRETLYRTLSARGNPTLATLDSILEVLGLEREFRARRPTLVRAPRAVSPAPASTPKLTLVQSKTSLLHRWSRLLGQGTNRLPVSNAPVSAIINFRQVWNDDLNEQPNTISFVPSTLLAGPNAVAHLPCAPFQL